MMLKLKLTTTVAAAAALLACTPQPTAPRAEVKDKLYAVTPDAMKVKAGILTGEMTAMKIVERVEDGSGRIESPARLTGKLVLTNVSPDQTVRLLGGNVVYIDMQGKPIPLENNRTEPTLRLSSSYGNQERLDPGQEVSQSVEAEFPVDGLKGKRLKEIRVDLQYIPSTYRRESLRFGVAVGQ